MAIEKHPAKKLTIYLDDGTKYHGKPVHKVLLNLFMEKKIAGATLFKGAAGYGGDMKMHSASVLRLTEDLPMKIEVVDSAEKIEAILDEVVEIAGKGFVDLADTEIIRRA